MDLREQLNTSPFWLRPGDRVDYCTTRVTGVVCEKVPEVAETVTVYVPAGVPVVVVVELWPPQAGCSATNVISNRNKRAPRTRLLQFLGRRIPKLTNARPVIGSQTA
jgi:hypothetical protein